LSAHASESSLEETLKQRHGLHSHKGRPKAKIKINGPPTQNMLELKKYFLIEDKMSLLSANQDLLLSAEPSKLSNPERWQALDAKLNRSLQGVGGFPSLGPGYKFAKIQSLTQDFKRWLVIDEVLAGLNVQMITETGLPITVAGNALASFGVEDGNIYQWSLVLAGTQLRLGYIQATATLTLRYTTKEAGFEGRPVYVITTPNKGQNQEMVLAAKGILEQLQIGAKVQRLVIAPNRSLDPNATNPWSQTVLLADITGSLALTATDIFTLSGSVPMTYEYQDPQVNNASTLTVSTATITGGVLPQSLHRHNTST
jgi:hypothetical protein